MRLGRRGVIVAVIVAVVFGALVIDRGTDDDAEIAVTDQGPVSARASARSSAWFCTGVTASDGGVADGTVEVVNAGRTPLNGTITVVPSQGDTKQLPFSLQPASRNAIHLREVTASQFASAIIELDGGEAAVEMTGTGPLGKTSAPCASASSSEWYFAEGITTKDAVEVLAVFNPFPEDAILDFVFSTDEGQVTPQDLTGLSIRGRSMLALNVGDFVQRRNAVAASVTARTGRIIVSRLQVFDGSAGRKGVTLAMGASSPGDTWYFPEGRVADGVAERYQIYNPADDEAQVQIDLVLEQGEAEPIVLSIPAESRVTMTANDEPRIPKNVAFGAMVSTLTDVDVVVERSTDFGPPSGRVGVAHTVGARQPAERWLLAVGETNARTDQFLVVLNPGDAPLDVTVAHLAGGSRVPVGPAPLLRVPPGQRGTFKLNDHVMADAVPLLVEATEPVVVERGLYANGATGVSMVMGIPFR